MNYGIKNYFDIRELVCQDVYRRHGERAWQFLDPRMIDDLLYIRQGMAAKITVNTWMNGGLYSQRGLRCNLCSLLANKTKGGVLYLSAHQQGMAVDFDVEGKTADEVRKWIIAHRASLPHPCRIENGTSWVHLDVRVDPADNDRVQTFNG